MNTIKKINSQRNRRKNRTRTRIEGTVEKPRLTIFRSNTSISAQLIDDRTGKTLISAHHKKNIKSSEALGKKIAAEAKKAGIVKVVLDRGAYQYHGNIKAVAESARAEGLQI